MRVLLLCDYRPFAAAMVSDHINAFTTYSEHEVFVYSGLVANLGELPVEIDLEEFDAVVVHYSIFLAVEAYLSARSQHRLKHFQGIKAAFIQDEYRFVDTTVERLRDLGFDLLFSCVPESEIEKVYPAAKLPKLRKVNTLTGYVPPHLIHYRPLPLRKRRLDVVYRGRKYPLWFGRLGLEKWQLAKSFRRLARRSGLRVDISWREHRRAYGSDWPELIRSARAMLGVESGASVFDFSGEIAGRVETLQMLLGEKRLKYEEVREAYFKNEEDRIDLAQISPRIFEAIALRTLCLLYEGRYSGILVPWRHYIPLKKDHSNMAEVSAALKNDALAAKIIADAYAEIALNERYSYRSFIARFDSELAGIAKENNPRGHRIAGRFATPADWYAEFPFQPVVNPYAVSISRQRRWLSTLLRIMPKWLLRRLRLLLGDTIFMRGSR